jgi:hypothetical protein
MIARWPTKTAGGNSGRKVKIIIRGWRLFNQEIDLRLPLSQSFITGLPDRADGRAKVDGAHRWGSVANTDQRPCRDRTTIGQNLRANLCSLLMVIA